MYRYPKITSHRQVNHLIKLNNKPHVVPQSQSKKFKIHLQDDHYIIKYNNKNIIKVKLRVYHIHCYTTGVILEYRDAVKHEKVPLLQGGICNKLESLSQECKERKGKKTYSLSIKIPVGRT